MKKLQDSHQKVKLAPVLFWMKKVASANLALYDAD
jgi:hypothetical protein